MNGEWPEESAFAIFLENCPQSAVKRYNFAFNKTANLMKAARKAEKKKPSRPRTLSLDRRLELLVECDKSGAESGRTAAEIPEV